MCIRVSTFHPSTNPKKHPFPISQLSPPPKWCGLHWLTQALCCSLCNNEGFIQDSSAEWSLLLVAWRMRLRPPAAAGYTLHQEYLSWLCRSLFPVMTCHYIYIYPTAVDFSSGEDTWQNRLRIQKGWIPLILLKEAANLWQSSAPSDCMSADFRLYTRHLPHSLFYLIQGVWGPSWWQQWQFHL